MRRGGAERSRLWRWRFLLALVLTSALTAGGLGGGYWYLGQKLEQAESVDLDLATGPPTNFLVLGSDSRAFVADPQDQASFGSAAEEPGQRADVILVVRVDPVTRRALVVSIPRDTLIGAPGGSARAVNGLFNQGPQAVVDGLQQGLAVPIHHYLELDFAGFRRIVDAIGGVSLSVPWPVRDRKTGLDLRQAGCNRLDGRAALAWVRSRGFSYLEDGRWRTDPRGDLGRIERQQALGARMAEQAVRRVALNPLRANQLADVVMANVKVDSELGAGDVLRLARSLRSFGSEAVEMVALPTTPAGPRVRPAPEAESLLARLRGEALEEAAKPEGITVRVLNGSGVAGQARRATAALARAGFATLEPADAEGPGHARTSVRHGLSSTAAARTVASFLNGVGRLVTDPELAPSRVVVVVGADWKGVAEQPGTSPPAPGPGVPPRSQPTPVPGPAARPAPEAPPASTPPPATPGAPTPAGGPAGTVGAAC